jgi:PAS domain S-box-containing protein
VEFPPPVAVDQHGRGDDDQESLRQALDSKQALLDAVMGSSYDGICLVSADGTFLEMNGAFERITGLARRDWVGRTIAEMRATPGMARNSAALQVLNGNGAAPATTLVNVRGGELILVTANPHRGPDGALESIILNVRNITQLNFLKRQIERARGDEAAAEFDASHLRERLEDAGLGSFVFKSPLMSRIVATVFQVADFDLTVLIEGETGVGKGVLAKLLHRLGRRAGGPFVEVNCGAIPESLVESELFGYEPGAFTGSSRAGKRGLFEAADGGTIFLDEIGELPKSSQAKLLKILDDRVLTRVGGTAARPLNVRVIAATNRRLRDLVRQGAFRADLLYRLETIPILVPPLRERHEDLRALIDAFVAKYGRELGCERPIGSEAVQRLMTHPLPGNARELKNIVVRLLLNCSDREIGPEHIASELDADAGGGELAPPPEAGETDDSRKPMKARLEEVECRILAESLRECRSTYEIAQRLGINQSSVVRKIKKYGLRARD